MSTQFSGRFEIKVDPKFRLTLPVPFREVLSSDKATQIFITNSQYQKKRCLDVYSVSEWQKLENKISKLPQLKIEVQNFQRFYLSGGHNIEIDSQGRILIPPSLRTYAGIKSEVVLVGFAHKFEIWAAEIWKTLFESLAQDFNDTLVAVSGLHDE